MIGLTIMVGLFSGLALYSMCCTCQITHQGEPNPSSLEQDARRDWDEQVKALGCTEPELYFSKPNSEGGVIDPSPPTTNELNS